MTPTDWPAEVAAVDRAEPHSPDCFGERFPTSENCDCDREQRIYARIGRKFAAALYCALSGSEPQYEARHLAAALAAFKAAT